VAYDKVSTLSAEITALDARLSAQAAALEARVAKLEGAVVTPPPNPVPVPGRVFNVSANWNTKIAAGAVTAGGSASLVSRLAALGSFNLNQNAWAVNVARAPVGFSGPRVSALNPDGWRMEGIPMLPEAIGTPDSDAHLVIIDEDKGLVWNFQGNTKNLGSSYTAEAFGVFRLGGPGWWDPTNGPWTGRSSNACLLGGLILPDELIAGVIPHALAIGVDGSLLAAQPVLPAKTTDAGGVVGGLPNGSRLQLDPLFDINTIPGREARIIAKAMQDYGVFVVERTTGVALYFQSTSNGKANYSGMNFSGLVPGLWNRCRILLPNASYAYDSAPSYTPPMPHK
jgi:stage V sporulation protein SpoVS